MSSDYKKYVLLYYRLRSINLSKPQKEVRMLKTVLHAGVLVTFISLSYVVSLAAVVKEPGPIGPREITKNFLYGLQEIPKILKAWERSAP